MDFSNFEDVEKDREDVERKKMQDRKKAGGGGAGGGNRYSRTKKKIQKRQNLLRALGPNYLIIK